MGKRGLREVRTWAEGRKPPHARVSERKLNQAVVLGSGSWPDTQSIDPRGLPSVTSSLGHTKEEPLARLYREVHGPQASPLSPAAPSF